MDRKFDQSNRRFDLVILKADQLEFGYSNSLTDAFDLEIKSGSRVGIFGRNGSGKSTLLNTLSGLIYPLRGKLSRENDLNLSYVPQYFQVQEIFPFTVREILKMGERKKSSSSYDQHELISKFQLEPILDQVYRELSGGQKQKVFIVRALLSQPDLLFLDEAWQGLDQFGCDVLGELILENKDQIAWVLVDHDYSRLLSLVDYCLVIKDQNIRFLSIDEFKQQSEWVHYFGICR